MPIHHLNSRTIRDLGFVIAGLLVLATTACAGSASTAAPSAVASGAPQFEDDPLAPPTEVSPTASGWIAGHRVTPTRVDYDPESGVVTVGARVENTGDGEDFAGRLRDSILLSGSDGDAGWATAPARIEPVVLARATTDVEITYELGDQLTRDALDVSRLGLVFGSPGPGAVGGVPFAPGSEPVGIQPVAWDLSESADAGGLIFAATRAEVVPWGCDDADDYGAGGTGQILYGLGRSDMLSLVVWGDIRETVSIYGGDQPYGVSLTLPDGTSTPQIGKVWTVFDLGESVDRFPLCFQIPRPAQGTYTVNWVTYRGAEASFPVTVDPGIGCVDGSGRPSDCGGG